MKKNKIILIPNILLCGYLIIDSGPTHGRDINQNQSDKMLKDLFNKNQYTE